MDEITQNVGNETDPKLENLLNLALDATQEELRKSGDLKTGYDPEDNVWELIIKYQGSLDELKEQIPRIRVIPLLRGYAVLYVEQQYVERWTQRSSLGSSLLTCLEQALVYLF